jgi:acyl carrier protein
MSTYQSLIEAALTDAVGRPINVSQDTHLINDEVLDSLDSAVFLLNVEKASNIKLPEKDVEDQDLFKVSNLIAYLESHKSS